MNEVKLFLKNWSSISVTAFLLNYLLWYLTTEDAVLQEFQYRWDDFVFDFLYCGLYVLVSLSLSNLIRRLLLGKRYSFAQFFLHSGAILVSNVLIAILFESVVSSIYQVGDEIFWDRLYIFITIATLLTIIYLCLYYSRIVIQQGKRNVEMQKELLKLQLDPHFVFNSLSTLTELISEDPELAETFTLKFSAIYRYMVDRLNKETVTISEEIRFIREYCDLLCIRHPHHFVFEIDKSLDSDGKLILPMSVQILVENAVKHNAHSARMPLHVDVYREGDYVVVSNKRMPLTGKLPATNKIGLKNLSERYSLFGIQPIIEAYENVFVVKLPIIKNTQERKFL